MADPTPGPWTLSRKESRISAYLIGADGFHITYFPVQADYWNEPEEWDNTRDGANARLIAAAPELLEALEAAEILCTATVIRDRSVALRRPESVDAREILERSEATLTVVRAAIAKARGQ